MENHSSITELFAKYLRDQCTPDEIRRLMQYFQSDENEEQLKIFIRAELEFKHDGDITDSREEAILSQVKSNLIAGIKQNQPDRSALIMFWIKMAAFWLLVIGISVGLLFTRFWKRHNPEMFTIVKTLRGERKNIVLSDGTKIWLSPSSKLEYPDQLIGNSREVKLEGEAFFNVAKDKIHPFVIHSDHMNTQVVGTSFDVRSFKGEAEYRVTVVTGIVRVSGFDSLKNTEKTVMLKPYQQSRFNRKSGNLNSMPYPDAWQTLKLKDGLLDYSGASVQQIVADLSRYYDRQILLESHSKGCLFSGEFDCNRPLDIALEQLAVGINAKVIIQKDDYILKGGCEE